MADVDDLAIMASHREHMELHIGSDKRVEAIEARVSDLAKRIDQQEVRLNWAMALAIVGAAGGGLFGLINFILLLQLYGRLS